MYALYALQNSSGQTAVTANRSQELDFPIICHDSFSYFLPHFFGLRGGLFFSTPGGEKGHLMCNQVEHHPPDMSS